MLLNYEKALTHLPLQWMRQLSHLEKEIRKLSSRQQQRELRLIPRSFLCGPRLLLPLPLGLPAVKEEHNNADAKGGQDCK